MDGPVAFVVHRDVGDSGRIVWGNRDNQVSVGIIQVPKFLDSSVAAARVVTAACRRRTWTSSDLEHLEWLVATRAV